MQLRYWKQKNSKCHGTLKCSIYIAIAVLCSLTPIATFGFSAKVYRVLVACSGAVLRWGRGHLPPKAPKCPQLHLFPPSEKLHVADHSDVISGVPKCSKIQIYSALPDTLYLMERGLAAPCQEPHVAVGPLGLVSTGLGSNPLQSWQPY